VRRAVTGAFLVSGDTHASLPTTLTSAFTSPDLEDCLVACVRGRAGILFSQLAGIGPLLQDRWRRTSIACGGHFAEAIPSADAAWAAALACRAFRASHACNQRQRASGASAMHPPADKP